MYVHVAVRPPQLPAKMTVAIVAARAPSDVVLIVAQLVVKGPVAEARAIQKHAKYRTFASPVARKSA